MKRRKKKLTKPYSLIIPPLILFIGISPLLFISLPANSLSTTTAETIQGSPPSLSTTLVTAIQNGDNFVLFGLSDGTNSYYEQSDIDTHFFSGLNLTPQINQPNDLPTLSLVLGAPSTITPNVQALDNDGDTIDSLTEKTIGGLKLAWYNAGTNTQLTTTQLNLTFCKLSAIGIIPELRAEGAITLKTKYGIPLSQDYPDTSIGVTLTPKRTYDYTAAFDPSADPVCFAKPSLESGRNSAAGPATMWDTLGGFIPQASGNNFPTTGANRLYFNLIVAGIDATTLTWPQLSNGGGNGSITVSATATSINTVEVILLGPIATHHYTGAVAYATTLPSTFVIEGKDSGNNVRVSYGFELKKWYINRGKVPAPAQVGGTNIIGGITYNDQTTWCANLNGSNYALVTVADLTNSSGTADGSGGIIPGALPGNSNPGQLNPGGNYWRYIGGGLSSEWGNMASYTRSGFENFDYWTNDTTGPTQFVVRTFNGFVSSGLPTDLNYGVCIQR